jgi:ribosomal protein S18 acetylase RimI-like enzyme
MAESLSFRIRLMEPGDLDQALSLSLSEGWNQTREDWQFLLSNPENICIVAEKDNRLAGTATALIHDRKVAWIGMVLVDKSLRGQGAGKMLMKDIIARLHHVRAIKLDATPAGEPLYTSLGFLPEHGIIRMTCSAYDPAKGAGIHEGIFPVEPGYLQKTVDFDTEIFGVGRSDLINHLASKYPELSFCHTIGDRIDGFIQGRYGSKFTYIGPAEAVSAGIAIDLISKTLSQLPGKAIALDIPEDKEEVVEWLESAGFIRQRYFTRMYLDENPWPGITDRQYLISGPEFG